MHEYSKKEIAFERVLFFSDAIVAIAITLLALDLKLQVPEGKDLSFADLMSPWHKYLAFILSFVNIAGFWRTHHDFFVYIIKMDERVFFFNICWLFFIVTLPFATTVLSDHFGQGPRGVPVQSECIGPVCLPKLHMGLCRQKGVHERRTSQRKEKKCLSLDVESGYGQWFDWRYPVIFYSKNRILPALL